jgi:Fur family ferric uptake transcriptional regulator
MKNEYSTKQRTIILNFLRENSAHVTASDIISHLREQNISVGTATVYRTLDKLVSQGILKKMIIDERSGACYQYTESAHCSEHFHLKCISCGKLIHLSCDFLQQMEKHILDDHGFKVSSGKTVIYGHCSDCSDKEIEQY